MISRLSLLAAFLLLAINTAAQAQPNLLPPADKSPLLRLETDGPTSAVTGLAFSPDGKTLYTAGFDKVVRVWNLNPKTKKFLPDPAQSYRIPIAPGLQGAINALAVSPDGNWLAVGGHGMVRDLAGFDAGGRILPPLGYFTPAMRRDQGLIYLFHTRTRQATLLAGHTGPVLALAFGPSRTTPLLVSAAEGWDDKTDKRVGEVLVWKIGQPKEPTRLPALPAPVSRPGLLALAGDQPRVVIAWGDGQLRLCDLAAPVLAYQSAADGSFNSSVAALSGKSFLTASFRNPKGKLTEWNAGGQLAAARGSTLDPVGNNKGATYFFYPRALALVSAGGQAAPAQVALVTRRQLVRTQNGATQIVEQKDLLQLLDLRPGFFGQLRSGVELWDASGFQPVIAAGPGADFVAVAGSADHQVRIYAVADLLQDRFQPQVLQSPGVPVSQVAFFHKVQNNKKQLGLALNKQANGRPAWLFDFGKNRLSADSAGWAADQPAPRPWRWNLKRVKNQQTGAIGKTVVTVSQGQQTTARLEWPADMQVTALDLTPTSPLQTPLLAVGLYLPRTSEQYIDVYDAATGRQLRRLQGHLAKVRSLAFGAGGKLLASAADDQAVAVWSLTDLDSVRNKFGRLAGFAVQEKAANKLVLAPFDGLVDVTAPPAGLAAGDLVEGVQVKGKLSPFGSARQLYDFFWLARPDEAVTLQVRAPQGQPKQVAIKVGQGVDERKPLFYLFVAQPPGAAAPDWVAWNPTGVFDSSRVAAEKFLGVHFNTGDLKKPVSFAAIQEYRQKFHLPGILKHLVDRGDLSQGLKSWKEASRPLAVPRLELVSVVDGAGDVSAPTLVRQRPVQLRLTLHDYRADPGDVVEWQTYRQGQWQTVRKEPGEDVLLLPLALADGAGDYRYQVLVSLHGKTEQPTPVERLIRYQPPAPEVTYEGPVGGTVNEPVFPFKATVQPGKEVPIVHVTLIHQHGDQTERFQYLVKARQPIDKALTLQPGKNLIQLVARNDKALAKHENDETRQLTVQVELVKKQVAKAEIVLNDVVPLPAGPAGAAQLIQPGQRLTVAVPRIQLRGKIAAKENLAQAAWDRGEGTKAIRLAGFDPTRKDCPIAEVVDLKPGLQTIRLLAQTPNSQPASQALEVFYQPALPALVLLPPAPEVLQNRIDLEGKFLAPDFPAAEPFPMKVSILVNDQPARELVLDSSAKLFKVAQVTLLPNHNEVRVRLAHAWDGSAVFGPLSVRHVRPPEVVKVDATRVDQKALAEVSARVRSASALNRERVKILVNGAEQSATELTIEPAADAANKDLWAVRLQGVPLREGDNALQLFVSNAEAVCREPGLAKVHLPRPVIAPPVVVILSPAGRTVSLREPELVVRWLVKSAVPLKSLQLRREQEILYAVPLAELAAAKPNDLGFYEFATPKILLDWDQNTLVLEARNEGGASAAAREVTILPAPVAVVVEKLEVRVPRVQNVEPTTDASGRLVFPRLPGGRARLYGVVRWSARDDQRLQKQYWVHVHVNDFLQFPVKLEAPAGTLRERRFRVDLLLNAAESAVEIVLPGLPREAGPRTLFTLQCQAPLRGQFLHVVIVAPKLKANVPARDAAFLKSQVLAALKAQPAGTGYRTVVFDEVRVHMLAGGNYWHSTVEGYLRKIADEQINQRASQGYPNDVLLLYYQGLQTTTPDDVYFWTSETLPGQEKTSALSLRSLTQLFGHKFSGAQLVFLDVAAPDAGETFTQAQRLPENLLAQARFATFRYQYLGKLDTPTWPRLLPEMRTQLPVVPNIQVLAARMTTQFQTLPPAANRYDQWLPARLKIQFQP